MPFERKISKALLFLGLNHTTKSFIFKFKQNGKSISRF